VKIEQFFNRKCFNKRKTMQVLNYENGIEYLFQFLRPKELVIFATLDKSSLSLVQKYFVTRDMLSLKIDRYSTVLEFPKNILFKITLGRKYHIGFPAHPISRFWEDSPKFIFRPVSMKNHHIYGWIISGNNMMKTGDDYRPYPWRIHVNIPYIPLEKDIIIDLPLSGCSGVTRVIGRNPLFKPIAQAI
jgi:hypothetical protein